MSLDSCKLRRNSSSISYAELASAFNLPFEEHGSAHSEPAVWKVSRHNPTLLRLVFCTILQADFQVGAWVAQRTGAWTQEEAVRLHVPTPTLRAAHEMRITSANRGRRLEVHENLSHIEPHRIGNLSSKTKEDIVGGLHVALYATHLASYVQGVALLDKANEENRWEIDFPAVIQVWRAGCIIRPDHIADLCERAYKLGRMPDLLCE